MIANSKAAHIRPDLDYPSGSFMAKNRRVDAARIATFDGGQIGMAQTAGGDLRVTGDKLALVLPRRRT